MKAIVGCYSGSLKRLQIRENTAQDDADFVYIWVVWGYESMLLVRVKTVHTNTIVEHRENQVRSTDTDKLAKVEM